MIYRQLGKTGINVSAIGLGTWQLGGLDVKYKTNGESYSGGWGGIDANDASNILNSAASSGINTFDTADCYGSGNSEKFIGQFIKNKRREEIVIVTKVGYVLDCSRLAKKIEIEHGQNFTPEYIRLAYSDSAERLQTNIIDVYLLHISKPDVVKKHKPWSALRKLRAQNKIRAYGVSLNFDNFCWIEELTTEYQCEVIEIPVSFIDLNKTYSVLEYCRAKNIGVIARSPLKAGALSGKYQPGYKFADQDWRNHYFGNRSEFDRATLLIEKVKPLVRSDRTLTQLALKFVLQNNTISTVVVGARSPSQVIENANSIKVPLLRDEIAYIEKQIS